MISVVIPAYRESANVTRAIAEVREVLAGISGQHEIVVVDDGSPDDTSAQAQSVPKSGAEVVVLRHRTNSGPGAAFRTGFSRSRGEIVVTLDCDLSFDPRQIPILLERLQSADVVLGAQHGPGARMENIPALRIVGSRLVYLADRVMLGGQLASYSTFFCAYRGPVIRELQFAANGFEAQCEILVRLSRAGARMVSVPCTLAWRDKRRSSSMRVGRELGKRLRLWWQFNRFRRLPPGAKPPIALAD